MRASTLDPLLFLVLVAVLAAPACTADTGALGLPPTGGGANGDQTSMPPPGEDDELGDGADDPASTSGDDATTASTDAGASSSGERRDRDADTSSSNNQDAGSTTSTPDSGAVTQQLLVTLDATQDELPRGLEVRSESPVIGFFHLGAIRWALASTKTIIGGSGGAMNGIAWADTNNLYIAFAGGGTATATTGVYYVEPDWPSPMLLANDPALVHPNGIVFDGHETAYVTDSVSGRIFKIGWDRVVRTWSEDPLLASSSTVADLPCGSLGVGFPMGASGITFAPPVGTTHTAADRLVVVNMERAIVLSIPILRDGSAGTATVIAGPDCTNLFGADGIALDDDGSFVITVQVGAKLVRVRDDGTTYVLTSGGLLDGPAGIVLRRHFDASIGDVVPPTRAYVANSTMIAPPTVPRPGPSIVVVELDR